MSLYRRLAAFVSFVVLLALAPQGALADRFDPIRERAQAAVVKGGLPSVAVAIAEDGQIVFEQGFGWANREKRREANEHTMYSLASISKPITATGIMLLHQRGKLDLDKPANDYLGEAKLRAHVGDANEATVRRLANHTAGLPLHYQFFYRDEEWRPPSPDETVRRYGILITPPGERHHYANLGYGVLDMLITNVSGLSYGDFLRQEVFLPLGLTHMTVDVGPGLEEYEAVRYSPSGNPLPHYEFDHPGASAVYSSAHDLARFGMFHLKAHLPDQKAILSDESIDAMQVPTCEVGPGVGYGVGWGTNETNKGYRRISHSGGMPGVSTLLTLVPEHKLVVVVLTNSRSGLPGSLTDLALKIAIPEKAEEEKEADEKKEEKGGGGSDESNEEETEVPLASALGGKWKGTLKTYQGETPVELEVQDSGDVHVKIGRQMQMLVNDARWHKGQLRGRIPAEIDTPDCQRLRHDLALDLHLRDDKLCGALVALSRQTDRGGNALAHWVELTRATEK